MNIEDQKAKCKKCLYKWHHTGKTWCYMFEKIQLRCFRYRLDGVDKKESTNAKTLG